MSRPHCRPLPPLDFIRDRLCYDSASPSGLRFVRNMPPRGRAGEPAGGFSGRYFSVNLHGRSFLAHRLVWYLFHGEDPGPMTVDHIDGDRSNNNIENLRLCSQSENLRNAHGKRQTASIYKGVHRAEKGRWGVSIRVSGHMGRFGTYPSEREAAGVYNDIALALHGEFARINDLDNPGATIPAPHLGRAS